MRINRNNYETYFIDYLDDNLNPSEISELKVFLKENPDLKEELELFENITLIPEETTLLEKESLKKSNLDYLLKNFNSFDEICIAKIEGYLTIEENKKFLGFLAQNPDKEREFDLYKKTILIPDESITYSLKASLKRFSIGESRRRIIRYLIPAAAAAVLIFGILLFQRYDIEKNLNQTDKFTQTIKKEDLPDRKSNIDEKPETISVNINKQVEENTELKNHFTKSLAEKEIITSNKNNHPFENIKKQDNLFAKAESDEIIEIVDDTSNTERKLMAENINYGGIDKNNELYASIIEEINRELKPKEKPKPPVTLEQYSTRLFRKRILKEDPPADDNRKFSVWDLADAGIKGIKNIFGGNMELNKEYDEDGNVAYLAFDSRAISFSTQMRK